MCCSKAATVQFDFYLSRKFSWKKRSQNTQSIVMQPCQVLTAACVNTAEQVLNHPTMMLINSPGVQRLVMPTCRIAGRFCSHFELRASSSCIIIASRFSQLGYMFIGYNYNSVFQHRYTPSFHMICKWLPQDKFADTNEGI